MYSGQTFNLTCTGREDSASYSCLSEKGSVCAYWSGSAWDQSCTVYKITAANTTCHCYNLSQALTSRYGGV